MFSNEYQRVQSIGRSRPDSIRTIMLEFPFGAAAVTGGPYLHRLPGYAGVKLAAEIDAECAINLPTEDFSVPDVEQCERALAAAIALAAAGSPIYVGCMGGIGRTGLFLALLAKISLRSMKPWYSLSSHQDPVAFIRNTFKPHAVETKQQQEYVQLFNTHRLERLAKSLR
jgi:hypothetical protein